MSLYDYEISKTIATKNYPFYALLMALIRQADTDNLEKIKREWPGVVEEFKKRYNAPGGFLDGEKGY